MLNKTTQDINTSTILRKESDESTHFPSSYCPLHPHCVDIFSSSSSEANFLFFIYDTLMILCVANMKRRRFVSEFFITFLCPSQVNTWHCLITFNVLHLLFWSIYRNNLNWWAKNAWNFIIFTIITQKNGVRTVKRLMVFKWTWDGIKKS